MKTIYIKFIIVLTLFLIFETYGNAQKIPELTVDLDNPKMSDTIPFDIPYILHIKSTKLLKNIKIFLTDSNFKFKSNCKNDGEKNEGAPLNCWESQEGALLAAIRMPPLKPGRIFQIKIDATIEPDKELEAEVKKKITESILNILKQASAENYVNNIAENLEKEFPKIFQKPYIFKGITVTPVKNSIFDPELNNPTGLTERSNRIKEILGFIDPIINKNDLMDLFPVDSEILKNLLLKIKKNDIAKQINLLKIEEGRDDIKKEKELIVKLLALGNLDIIYISQGMRALETKENYIIKAFSGFEKYWDPKDCVDQIVNYNQLYHELSTFRLLLFHVESSKFYFDQIKNKGRIPELINAIEECKEKILKILNTFDRLKNALLKKDKIIENALDNVILDLIKEFLFLLSTTNDFVTRAKFYVIPDIGIAWAPIMKEVFPFFGVNFYFRPINKEVPLRILRKLKNENSKPLYKNILLHQISAIIGISIKSIASPGRRENLFVNSALLLGGGFRFSDALRISIGVMGFKALDPNPLISEKQIKWTPFISSSLDLDLKDIINDFISLITGK